MAIAGDGGPVKREALSTVTIVTALISRRDGVVASDGRIFTPAYLENGSVVREAEIESDMYDKTFALRNGEVIGAFAGLIRYSGKSITEHVTELAENFPTNKSDLADLANAVSVGLRSSLSSIEADEVLFSERNLDVLLVAGRLLTRAEIQIVSLHFAPEGDQIIAQSEVVVAEFTNRYYLRGNDQATAAAIAIYAKGRATKGDVPSMLATVGEAIKAGIGAAGIHKYGSDPDCGGKVFARRTWYG